MQKMDVVESPNARLSYEKFAKPRLLELGNCIEAGFVIVVFHGFHMILR